MLALRCAKYNSTLDQVFIRYQQWASITASATWPLCSLIVAGFHPLCSIDIGAAPYQEGRALFRKSLGGIGGGLIVKAIVSQ
jgi:hypothetical protein